MSSPLTFGLADTMRRLGLKGSWLPSVAPRSPVQPVMVVADLSRSLASEVFEGRAISARATLGIAGAITMVQMHSRAPGGSVVEFIVAKSTLTQIVRIRTSTTPTAFNPLGGTVGQAALGGVPTLNVVQWGYATAGGIFGTIDTVAAPIVGVPMGGRWFIPPGSTLELGSSDDDTDFEFTMQWRELSSIQGAA